MACENVFQFKISLKYIKPEIWRRVLVPDDYTFKDLHYVIVSVMNWSDYHLHRFLLKHPVTNKEIEIFENGDDLGFSDNVCLPESTKLAEFFTAPKQKAMYEYDFGSTWYHIIVFEKAFPAIQGNKYPQCIDGKCVTPPEDDPGSDFSDSEDQDCFFPQLVNFKNCRDFQQDDTADGRIEDNSPVPNAEELPSNKSFQDTSDFLDDETENLGVTEENAELINKVSSSLKRKVSVTELQSSEDDLNEAESKRNNSAAQLYQKNMRENSIGSKVLRTEPVQRESSIMSQLENDVEEDIEEAYGKYIASQMRLITDLKMRELLRMDIQNCIKKYRFKKK